MTGAEYQLCGSIEPNTGHLPASLGAFLQPNSRVCRSSHASPFACRVEYFSSGRSRSGIRSFACKVIRSRELHRLRPPASVVRSLEGEAILGCCPLATSHQRRLEILSVRASLRFAARLPLEPAQPLCNYNVCMSRANSKEGSDEHPPSRRCPRLFEELTRHDAFEEAARALRVSRLTTVPIVSRSVV
jgi:hypothetical protein